MSTSKTAVASPSLRLDWRLPNLPLFPARWLRRLREAAVAWLAPLAALALWQASSAAGWLPPQVLPAPLEIWAVFTAMADSGELREHTAISLWRVAAGFALGGASGLAMGVAMGISRRLEAWLSPIFMAVAQVPPLGWIPLLIMLVGIDEALKVLVIAKAAFVPMSLNTLKGIRAVPANYLEVGRVLAFNRREMLTRIIFPAAAPPIFTGVRYGLTHAWLALVAVELLASSEGLGYLMIWGRQMFQLDLVIAAMIVVGAIGFAMDRGLQGVETRLQRWRLA